MKKPDRKNYLHVFIVIVAISLAFFLTSSVFADVTLKLQIPLPEFPTNTIDLCTGSSSIECSGIAQYIVIVYQWLIRLAVVLGAAALVFAGLFRLTAAGDAKRVETSTSIIKNTLIGLALAFSSYTILWTLNPNLVNLKELQLGKKIKEQRLIIDDGCDRDKLKRSPGISIGTFTHITFDDNTKADIETPNMVVQALVAAMKNIDTRGFNIKATIPSDRNSSHLGVHTIPITAVDFAGSTEELEKFRKYIEDNKILLSSGSTYLWDDGKYRHFDIDCKKVLEEEK